MTKSTRGDGIGQSIVRKEDAALVTGQGRFSDDLDLAGQAYAVMVRSPHAHARIRAIDADAALALPGVIAVLTGADAIADGLKPIPHRPLIGPPDIALGKPDTSDKFLAPHRVLPHDKARFTGEAVAMVIAESMSIAKDAAERVRVDFEPLPAVTDTVAAAGADAPQLWDEASSNVCIDAEVGDAAATAAAFARAAHVVKLDTWIQRVTGVPLEPRAAIGSYDAASGRTTLYAGSGGVVRQKHELAGVLDVPPDRVRVVSGDVGANFGTRNAFYPEFALVAWASRRIGRPVKWTCERQEAFLSDYQGRDLFVSAELALDGAGRFLALRGSLIGNVGAHTVSFVPLIKGVSVISGVYRIPAACLRARAVMSNTPPTNPYRSAGRPEAMFVIERLIDLAAAAHGFDRIELRRRNLIGADATPYTNPLGLTYDSGEYERVMDCALSLGHWDGFAQRRRAAARRGKRRGIAVANYIEFTTGAPREWTRVTVAPEGRVDVAIGTLSSGQGHQTSFAQLVTDWLGVPLDCIRLIQGDTDIVPVGGGSHSGRSMRLAGIVIGKASDTLIAKGKRIAAHVLEAAEHDIEFSGGHFTVQGTDRSIGIFEVAREACLREDLPDDLAGPLAAECDHTVAVGGFPYGSHVCEVEIDLELGTIEIVGYAAVDDVGRAVNPRILHGQSHGGIAQGIGQALLESCVYDRESGQLLSGSFTDYAIPRADDLLPFATEISEVLSPNNPLGVRAGGEGGTTPALAVVVGAVVDALKEFGVTHMEMPVTPEQVWREIARKRAPVPT
ncbi:MAG: xanthine dehydrogenase family protein molybdopterin-binding subunit [Xanthobacteraceae bacterium]